MTDWLAEEDELVVIRKPGVDKMGGVVSQQAASCQGLIMLPGPKVNDIITDAWQPPIYCMCLVHQ